MPNTCQQTVTTTLRFIVYGEPQQVGSKSSFVLMGKQACPSGGTCPIRRANGYPIVNTTDQNREAVKWTKLVQARAAASWFDPPYVGPVVLSAAFYFGRPKSHYGTGKNAGQLKASAPRWHAQTPDLSKLVRCLEDAMTGIVYVDDRSVVAYRELGKHWCNPGDERAEVALYFSGGCGEGLDIPRPDRLF